MIEHAIKALGPTPLFHLLFCDKLALDDQLALAKFLPNDLHLANECLLSQRHQPKATATKLQDHNRTA